MKLGIKLLKMIFGKSLELMINYMRQIFGDNLFITKNER